MFENTKSENPGRKGVKGKVVFTFRIFVLVVNESERVHVYARVRVCVCV